MESINVEQLLREHQIKPTMQRIAISEILLRSKEHPTVDAIYDIVKQTHPTVSLATVYKTVNTLKETHLVREFETGDGKAHYEPNSAPHINLICKKCGQIHDFEHVTINVFVLAIQDLIHTSIINQQLDFYIVCDDCLKG